MRFRADRMSIRLMLSAVLGLVLCLADTRGWAFALSEQLTHAARIPSEDLQHAARWSNIPGSLAVDGKRGLGGGVEYAVAGDFCDALLPRFIDEPKPECAALLVAIDAAFAQWADDSPHLRFTNVTGAVDAMLPPADAADPRRGYGAEVDILAVKPKGFPKPGPFGADTTIYVVNADPIGTNGKPQPGSTLTSADIVFNPTKCYFLDPILEDSGCNHFPSLMVHEIGMSLGLGQPDVDPKHNWDNDAHPEDAIAIDCDDPTKGLRLSRRTDPAAAANSSRGLGQRVIQGLTNDDRGGRDFLYPKCGAQ